MKPLTTLPRAEAAGLAGILFDLDDTFLDDGALTETAYAALFRLARAGLRLIAVTGRPAGYGEVMARQWPVEAVVTENGAVALYREKHAVLRWPQSDDETRRLRRERLGVGFAALKKQFPAVRASDDTHARESDIAIDIGESQQLMSDEVAAIESAARGLGFRTFVSSVHLHITLEPYDKATGTIAFLRARFQEDPTAARHRYAYIGDSANDAACFFAFTSSFGVANVAASLPRLSVPPRYLSWAERGAGFAEIADAILALRV
ncbi:MAG TPA: HAD-IIB family hydrolase [Polyangiaceae bacterium]|nr:HAD-IIB family hydrolase [Polyangiaceae bacterium]